ncbi:MAG: hypothetical protein HYY13_09810 [Nitrospirae bacterium]|nr:hypothetical protein [Nitrospirota bacterium]
MGVLVAVAVPNYIGYKARARNSVALSDAIKFSVAQESYFSETLGYIPSNAQMCNLLCQRGFMLSFSPPNWTTLTNYAVNVNGWSARFAHQNGSAIYNASSGQSSPAALNCTNNVCPTPNQCIPPNNTCTCPPVANNPCF